MCERIKMLRKRNGLSQREFGERIGVSQQVITNYERGVRELRIVDLKRKIDSMERRYDHQFKIVFDAIRQLLTPPLPSKPKNRMGFGPDGKNN